MTNGQRLHAVTAAFAACLMLAGCNNNDDGKTLYPVVTPTPVPTPTPTPASYDVTRCLTQTIPGTGGLTVARAVVPDVVTLTLNTPPAFPNGRRLADPVIDITLAVIFLDMTKFGPFTFANIPINPAANDLPFRSNFPYLAAPQGSPPLSGTGGTNFNFRTDPVSAYVRVDRMGMPAVATALIPSSRKNAYNDGTPTDDALATYVPDIDAQLTTLTNALADDFTDISLALCARPK